MDDIQILSAASSRLSYVSEGANKSNFSGCGKTLVIRGGGDGREGGGLWHTEPRGSRSSGRLISDLLTLFSCFLFFLSHVTIDRNVQTSDVGSICYLSKEEAFPGIKAAECSDAVPRSSGMKISLFIMGANQISDAVCLLAKRRWQCVER